MTTHQSKGCQCLFLNTWFDFIFINIRLRRALSTIQILRQFLLSIILRIQSFLMHLHTPINKTTCTATKANNQISLAILKNLWVPNRIKTFKSWESQISIRCLESTIGCLRLSHVHPLELGFKQWWCTSRQAKVRWKILHVILLPSRKADKQSSLYANFQIYCSHMCNSGGAGLVAQTSAVQYVDSLAESAKIFSFPSLLEFHILSGKNMWKQISSQFSMCSPIAHDSSSFGKRIKI